MKFMDNNVRSVDSGARSTVRGAFAAGVVGKRRGEMGVDCGGEKGRESV